MMYYDRNAVEVFIESDDDDPNETLDPWTLNDFNDLCSGAERAIAVPAGDENLAYPS